MAVAREEVKLDSYPLEDSQGSNIPRPPANIARFESFDGWLHSLGSKCKRMAFSSGARKDDKSLTVLNKNV